MKKYNFHTHTYRCGHAVGKDEEYVLTAVKNNYDILGFSDHCPYLNYSFETQRMEWNEYKEYINAISKLKDKYEKDIKIFIGFECEFYKEHLNQLIELKNHCDYLILGQHHYIKNKRCYNYYSFEELDNMLVDIEEGMNSKLFLYLAHPDYYLLGRPIWDKKAIDIAHKICELSLKYDIPLELNGKGIRNRKYGSLYPYPDFWKIVGEYNCKVCVGIDAHDPNNLNDKYPEIEELINKYNLNVIKIEELLKKMNL